MSADTIATAIIWAHQSGVDSMKDQLLWAWAGGTFAGVVGTVFGLWLSRRRR